MPIGDLTLRAFAADHSVAVRGLELARAERDILGKAIDDLVDAHAGESTLLAVDALYLQLCDAAEEAEFRWNLTRVRYQQALRAVSPDDELAWLA